MKEYKWQIVWSTRNSPQEISRMINDIRIRTLLDQRKLPVLGYPCHKMDLDNRYMLPDLTNPHGMINDITIDDEHRYIATFRVIDEFTPYFDCLFNPVIHPIILGNPEDSKSFKIVHLYAYDIKELNQKRIYDGIDPSGESFESKKEIYKSTLKTTDSMISTQNVYKVTCIVGFDVDFILIKAANEHEAWGKFWEHFNDEPNLNHEDLGSKENYEYVRGYWKKKGSSVSITIEPIHSTTDFIYIGGGRTV